MTPLEMQTLLDKLVDQIKAHIERQFDPFRSRISALETRVSACAMMLAGARNSSAESGFDLLKMHADMDRRIRAMEERSQLRYVGVWRETEHEPGDVATHSGQLWHCWTKTSARPGESDAWQLMAKATR
jgi:hypothetical protein